MGKCKENIVRFLSDGEGGVGGGYLQDLLGLYICREGLERPHLVEAATKPTEICSGHEAGEREGNGFSDEKQKGRKRQTISKIVTTGGFEETTKEEATPRIKLFGKRILKKGCG